MWTLKPHLSCVPAGLLIGMVAMLSQTGLVLFATFVGLAKKEDGRLERSYSAFAAWCFLIFFVYVSVHDRLGLCNTCQT